MDTKFITVFTVMTSLFIVIIASQVCGQWTADLRDAPVTQLFQIDNFIATAESCQVGVENQVNFTSNVLSSDFSNATSQLTTPSAGSSGSFGVSSFIDVLKLIAALISLLLGLPLYTFFFTIGLPYAIAVILTVFLSLMTVIGWMEFIRGGAL